MTRLVVSVCDYLNFPAVTSQLEGHKSDKDAIIAGGSISLAGTPLNSVVPVTDQLKSRAQVQDGLVPILYDNITDDVVELHNEASKATLVRLYMLMSFWKHGPVDSNRIFRGYHVPSRMCLHRLFWILFA